MKDRNLDNIIKSFYNDSYIEDERLTKDKMHHIEFITTTKYIDKYLKEKDRILEVGAGTGAYSLYYANKGYQVDAVELVKENLEILKSKITNNMNINAVEGNAIDLSMYQDNTFDVTLVLGPLYHLFKEDEINKAIREAIRVTKPNGKIYLAFILFDSSMLVWGLQNKNLYENYGKDKMVLEDFRPNNHEDLVFNLMYIDEVKKLVNTFNVKELHYVSTDSIAKIIKDVINNMNDKEYELYLKYHLSICERYDLIGFSGHILAILEKE